MDTDVVSSDDLFAARVWASVEYQHALPTFKGYFCVQCQVRHRAWHAVAFVHASLIGGNVADVRLSCRSCSTTIGVVEMVDDFELLAKLGAMGSSPAFFQMLVDEDPENYWQRVTRRQIAAVEMSPEERAELRAMGEQRRNAERRAPLSRCPN